MGIQGIYAIGTQIHLSWRPVQTSVKTISIARLCEIMDLPCPVGTAGSISGVSIDSRTIQPDDCFFAVQGENFDGHDFVENAREKNAACVIVEKRPPADLKIPAIQVPDTIEALGRLAAWHRSQLAATVIGITGSAGKTGTRRILSQVLSSRFRCRQSPKSFNNRIGVPLTLLSAQDDDQILLVEIGSNHPGEIAPLAKMARPDIAVITHITPAHLEGFGSIQAIIEEKASILDGLAPEGKVFINGDVPELAAWIRRKYNRPFTMVGQSPWCDIRPESMHTSGTSGWLRIEGQIIQVPLAGMASLKNVLTVWSICRDFNIPLSDFAQAVRMVKPDDMRLQIEHIGPVTILNDCYNANPASMENALDCLAQIAAQQKRRSVVIAGDMKELGPHSVSLHRQVGAIAARCGIHVILAAGQFAQAFMEGAAKTDNTPGKIEQIRTFGSTEALCNNVHRFIRPDDIILVKASRSARFEYVVDRLRDLFGKQQTTD